MNVSSVSLDGLGSEKRRATSSWWPEKETQSSHSISSNTFLAPNFTHGLLFEYLGFITIPQSNHMEYSSLCIHLRMNSFFASDFSSLPSGNAGYYELSKFRQISKFHEPSTRLKRSLDSVLAAINVCHATAN